MNNLVLADIVCSKRVWGVVIQIVVMALAHYHVIVTTDNQEAMVDAASTVAQGVWTIVTKIIDAKNGK